MRQDKAKADDGGKLAVKRVWQAVTQPKMATANDKAVLEALFNPLFSEFGFTCDPDEQRTTEGEGLTNLFIFSCDG